MTKYDLNSDEDGDNTNKKNDEMQQKKKKEDNTADRWKEAKVKEITDNSLSTHSEWRKLRCYYIIIGIENV